MIAPLPFPLAGAFNGGRPLIMTELQTAYSRHANITLSPAGSRNYRIAGFHGLVTGCIRTAVLNSKLDKRTRVGRTVLKQAKAWLASGHSIVFKLRPPHFCAGFTAQPVTWQREKMCLLHSLHVYLDEPSEEQKLQSCNPLLEKSHMYIFPPPNPT